jgi:hypothetical protein
MSKVFWILTFPIWFPCMVVLLLINILCDVMDNYEDHGKSGL